MAIIDGDSDAIHVSQSLPAIHLHPTPSPSPPPVPLPAFDVPSHDDVKNGAVELPPKARAVSTAQQQPARRVCARHQRMADEGTSLKLQQV